MANTTPMKRRGRTREAPDLSYARIFERAGAIRLLLVLRGEWIRYADIPRAMMINSNTLSTRLREMLELGLVERDVVNYFPPYVTYRLTPAGLQMQSVLRRAFGFGQRFVAKAVISAE